MKKIITLILVMLMFMALPAIAVNGNTSSQSIGQSAGQTIQGTTANNANLNQNIAQNVNQAQSQTSAGNVSGGVTVGSGASQSIGQNANQAIMGSNLNNATVRQGISQNASQMAQTQGSGISGLIINKSMGQNITIANQSMGRIISRNVSLSFENFTNTSLTTPMTAQERMLIHNRTGQFFTNFPVTGQFVVPQADLNRFIAENRNMQVVYVDADAWNRPGRIPGAMFIPLANFANQINQLPSDRPIVIVGSNNIDTAAAMTALRMNGINAWMAENPRCVCG